MNQAIKTLFFLFYVGPQLSFSSQAMEIGEEDTRKRKSNFSWQTLSRRIGSLPSSFKETVYRGIRKDHEEGKESKKNEMVLNKSSTSTPTGSATLLDISIKYRITDIIKFFDDEKIFKNPYHRAYVVRGLSNITPEEERSSAFVKAQSFLLKEMDGYDFAFLLSVISHLSEENRDFVLITTSHLPTAKEKSNRLLLLKAFYKIPPEEWNTLVGFVRKNKFFPETGVQARDKALNLIISFRLSKIPGPLRGLFLRYIPEAIPEPYLLHFLLKFDQEIFKKITTKKVKKFEFNQILKYFIDLSPLKSLSASETDENFSRKIRDSLDLLEVLCRIPFEELGYVLANAKLLIGDRRDMLGKGDLIETLLFIPEVMTVKAPNIGDKDSLIRTRGIIVDKAFSLITPEMDGRDISDILNTLGGFLSISKGEHELNPEFEEEIHNFVKFVERLKDIRKKIGTGTIDSQSIYAASMMPYSKRKTFLEDFDKFFSPLQKFSPKEILYRFLCFSQVPQGYELEAVALLNTAVQGMREIEREEVTKIASALVGTELKNFALLVDELKKKRIGSLYRCLIIKVFFKIGSIYRENFAKRPVEKFFNESFLPSFKEVSTKETYLRSLVLSLVSEDKEKEVILILNEVFKDMDGYDRELILETILTFPISDWSRFEDLISVLEVEGINPCLSGCGTMSFRVE
jgi:hypothetical protein